MLWHTIIRKWNILILFSLLPQVQFPEQREFSNQNTSKCQQAEQMNWQITAYSITERKKIHQESDCAFLEASWFIIATN